MNSQQPENQQIEQEAYRLWEQDGRPDGRDQEYWFRAQQSLTGQQKSTGRTGSARSVSEAGALTGKSETAAPKKASNGRKATARQIA